MRIRIQQNCGEPGKSVSTSSTYFACQAATQHLLHNSEETSLGNTLQSKTSNLSMAIGMNPRNPRSHYELA